VVKHPPKKPVAVVGVGHLEKGGGVNVRMEKCALRRFGKLLDEASKSLKYSTNSGPVEHSPRKAIAVSGVGYLQGGRECKNRNSRSAQLQSKPILIVWLL
jgi:hypothetical protein